MMAASPAPRSRRSDTASGTGGLVEPQVKPVAGSGGSAPTFGSAVAALMLFVLTTGAPAELRPQPVVLAALLQQSAECAVQAHTARTTAGGRVTTVTTPASTPRPRTTWCRLLQVRTFGLPAPRAPDDRTPHA